MLSTPRLRSRQVRGPIHPPGDGMRRSAALRSHRLRAASYGLRLSRSAIADPLSPLAGRGLSRHRRRLSEAAAEGEGAPQAQPLPESPPHHRSSFASASHRDDKVPVGLSLQAGRGGRVCRPKQSPGNGIIPISNRWKRLAPGFSSPLRGGAGGWLRMERHGAFCTTPNPCPLPPRRGEARSLQTRSNRP